MKTLLAAVVALSFSAHAQNKPLPTTYKIDPAASTVEWVGKKVAGPHNGDVKVKSGEITVLGEEITAGNIVIDMNSINTKDLEGEWKGKLDGHLKSPDFFDTEKYPEAVFTIKNSKKTDRGLELFGDLKIKDKTVPVPYVPEKFKTEQDKERNPYRVIVKDIKKTETMFSGKTTMQVNRINHGVMYNAGKDSSTIKSLGDKLIYDDFTLTINLTAKK